MRDLPLTLRWYLYVLFLVAVALVVGQVSLLPIGHPTRDLPVAAALFVLLTYVGERTVVRIGQSISLTLATTVHIATILLFPAPIPVLVTFLATLLSSLHDTEYPLYKRAFNVAHEVCTVGVCSLVVALVAAPSRVLNPTHVVALLPLLALLLALYYALDIGLVIGVFSLLKRRSPWATWRGMYRRTLLPELATISIGILAAASWDVSPVLLALFVLPVVALHTTFQAIAQAEERANALGHVLAAAERMQHLHQQPADLIREVATAAVAISGASVATAYLRDPEDPTRLERVAVVPVTADAGPRHVPMPSPTPDLVIGKDGQTATMTFALDGLEVIGLVALVGIPANLGNAGRRVRARGAPGRPAHAAVGTAGARPGRGSGGQPEHDHAAGGTGDIADAAETPTDGATRDVALVTAGVPTSLEVNDTFGHSQGDALLREVARRLRGAVRRGDTVARLGGDEFAVALPGADVAAAEGVASALRTVLDAPFHIGDHLLQRGTSVGIAPAPTVDDDSAMDTLLRHADVAMYVAKRERLGQQVYDPALDTYSPERLGLIAELRVAIAAGTLTLHYQPQADLASGRVRGVEALVRWPHPERGLIPPDAFIPLAEQTGLIAPLTDWALGEAIRQCSEWRRAGLALTMSVNLSVWNLHDVGLPDRIAALLQTHAVPPASLRLEVTETALMADPERALAVLTHLSALGVSLAVDDFGAGYSSLAYLKTLPVDELKIDKGFVHELATDATDTAIVAATVGLGHALGLRVVAEGIEDRASWDQLAGMGCDVAQGYYLSRPQPADALARWLRAAVWSVA